MRTLIFGGQSFSAEDYKKYFVDDFKLIESIDKIKDMYELGKNDTGAKINDLIKFIDK